MAVKKADVFFALKLDACQKALVKEYRLQLYVGVGSAVLKPPSFESTVDQVCDEVEAKAEQSEAEKLVIEMGHAEFAVAAAKPVHRWWYESGRTSGCGKLKLKFAENNHKRQRTELPSPATSAAGVSC